MERKSEKIPYPTDIKSIFIYYLEVQVLSWAPSIQ